MDDLTQPLFLGRLRLQRLTSNQMAERSSEESKTKDPLPGSTSSPSISHRPQWAGAPACMAGMGTVCRYSNPFCPVYKKECTSQSNLSDTLV